MRIRIQADLWRTFEILRQPNLNIFILPEESTFWHFRIENARLRHKDSFCMSMFPILRSGYVPFIPHRVCHDPCKIPSSLYNFLFLKEVKFHNYYQYV